MSGDYLWYIVHVDLDPFCLFVCFFQVLLTVIVIMIDGSEKCKILLVRFNFRVCVLVKGAVHANVPL